MPRKKNTNNKKEAVVGFYRDPKTGKSRPITKKAEDRAKIGLLRDNRKFRNVTPKKQNPSDEKGNETDISQRLEDAIELLRESQGVRAQLLDEKHHAEFRHLDTSNILSKIRRVELEIKRQEGVIKNLG